MKQEWINTLREMRDAGYAVIAWTPEELNGAHPSDVEDHSISYASEYLIPEGDGENIDIDLDGGMSAVNEQGEPCFYCGGKCPQDEDHACDGYLGDLENIYGETA